MAFAESLAPFFADFGVTATVGGVSVRGIFDNGHTLATVANAGMSGTLPTLTLPTVAVTASVVGQTVVVGGTSYVCTAHEPDGTGVSVLMLERA